MFDYHVHSDFSNDCEVPMAEFAEEAVRKGLSEICFTDHVDYDYTDPTISFNFDPGKRLEVLEPLRRRYADRLRILNGIEIGIQPHVLDRCRSLVEKWDFDFVIASVHTAGRADLYNGDFFRERSPRGAYRLYLEELLESVSAFDRFSVVGHIDIPGKYQKAVKALEPREFFDVYETIFKVLAEKGKGIEINTSAMGRGRDHMMPSIPLLKLYRETGGEILTLGSDSHVPATLAFEFDYVRDLLASLGFRYLCAYENRRPVFHRIDTLKK